MRASQRKMRRPQLKMDAGGVGDNLDHGPGGAVPHASGRARPMEPDPNPA